MNATNLTWWFFTTLIGLILITKTISTTISNAQPTNEIQTLSPFQSRNDACISSCALANDENNLSFSSSSSSSTIAPFLDLCPGCSNSNTVDGFSTYCSQQCRSCCQGGASSLKIRWHGCEARISIATKEDLFRDCNYDDDVIDEINTKFGFVECTCYDRLIQEHLLNSFEEIKDCTIVQSSILSGELNEYDICLVSTSVSIDSNTTLYKADFSAPLPSIIGIIIETDIVDDCEDDTTPIRRLSTYFDTTCTTTYIRPYSYPIFPGYGKFSNSCPYMSFIDLEHNGNPPLPSKINRFVGTPSPEMFWFQFIDGTSAGFWPNEDFDKNTTIAFDPTFKNCNCFSCEYSINLPYPNNTNAPTSTPSPNNKMINNSSSASPSNAESPSSTTNSPIDDQGTSSTLSPMHYNTNSPSLVSSQTEPSMLPTEHVHDSPTPSFHGIEPTLSNEYEPTTSPSTIQAPFPIEKPHQPLPKKSHMPTATDISRAPMPSEVFVDETVSPAQSDFSLDQCFEKPPKFCEVVAALTCRKVDDLGAGPCVYREGMENPIELISQQLINGDDGLFFALIRTLWESGKISDDWILDELKRNEEAISSMSESIVHGTST